MVRLLLHPPYLSPNFPAPKQAPVPPLETMVVPSTIVSEKGVSQVYKDIPPRPVPPQLEQCEVLEKNIL